MMHNGPDISDAADTDTFVIIGNKSSEKWLGEATNFEETLRVAFLSGDTDRNALIYS